MLMIPPKPPLNAPLVQTMPCRQPTTQPSQTGLTVSTQPQDLALTHPQQSTALVRAARFMGENKKPLIIGTTSLVAAAASGFGAEALIQAGVISVASANIAGVAVTAVAGGATAALAYGGKYIVRAYEALQGTVLANKLLDTEKPEPELVTKVREAHPGVMCYVCEQIVERIFATDKENTHEIKDQLNKLALFNGYGVGVLRDIVVQALSLDVARPDIAQKALLVLIKIDSEEARDALEFLRTTAVLECSLEITPSRFKLFTGSVRAHKDFTPEQMASIINWGGLSQSLTLRESEIDALWPYLTEGGRDNVEEGLTNDAYHYVSLRNTQGLNGCDQNHLTSLIKTRLLFLQRQFGQDPFARFSEKIDIRDAGKREGITCYLEALREIDPKRAVSVFAIEIGKRGGSPFHARLEDDAVTLKLHLRMQKAMITEILTGNDSLREKVELLINLWSHLLDSAPVMEALERQVQLLSYSEYREVVSWLDDRIRRHPDASRMTKVFVYRLYQYLPCRQSRMSLQNAIKACLEAWQINDAKSLMGYLGKIGDQSSFDFMSSEVLPLCDNRTSTTFRTTARESCEAALREIRSRLIDDAL
jgi:hypothetical protein